MVANNAEQRVPITGESSRIQRFWRHLLAEWRTLVLDRERVRAAVRASELRHSGEVRVIVRKSLPLLEILRGVTAREAAVQAFSVHRVWDTPQNNGVLLYLLIAEHDFEIVADRELNSRVSDERWRAIAAEIERHLRAQSAGSEDLTAGVICGIELLTAELAQYFPPEGVLTNVANDGANALSDEPVIE